MPIIDLKKLHPNKKNPRIISDEKFDKLVQSIKQFPEMLELRPIVVNEDYIALGGNMRIKACQKLKIKKVPYYMFTREMIKQRKEFMDIWKTNEDGEEEVVGKRPKTYEDYCDEFIIKDNVPYGEWDWLELNQWNTVTLQDYGLDVWDITSDDDIDGYFEESDQTGEGITKLILKYTPKEHEAITKKLKEMEGTNEEIIFRLITE